MDRQEHPRGFAEHVGLQVVRLRQFFERSGRLGELAVVEIGATASEQFVGSRLVRVVRNLAGREDVQLADRPEMALSGSSALTISTGKAL